MGSLSNTTFNLDLKQITKNEYEILKVILELQMVRREEDKSRRQEDKSRRQYYTDATNLLKSFVSIPGVLMMYVLNEVMKVNPET